MTDFQLPRDGEIYTASIVARCYQLISTRVWNGISPTALGAWLNNFSGDLERYFAACLLDALIYRSRDQTISLMDTVFRQQIPEGPAAEQLGPQALDLRESFRGREEIGMRIVPVIRLDDPPTKSGPLLARLYRRELRLNDKWMIWPWDVGAYLRRTDGAVIYVDDLLGTGSQFVRFWKYFNLDRIDSHLQVYAPLVAHEAGKKHLAEHAPQVIVAEAEALGTNYNLFATESRVFADGVNDGEVAKKFYDQFLYSREISISDRYRFGWGELALSYAFEHSVPNNSLPLYWFEHPNWNPLFRR